MHTSMIGKTQVQNTRIFIPISIYIYIYIYVYISTINPDNTDLYDTISSSLNPINFSLILSFFPFPHLKNPLAPPLFPSWLFHIFFPFRHLVISELQFLLYYFLLIINYSLFSHKPPFFFLLFTLYNIIVVRKLYHKQVTVLDFLFLTFSCVSLYFIFIASL